MGGRERFWIGFGWRSEQVGFSSRAEWWRASHCEIAADHVARPGRLPSAPCLLPFLNSFLFLPCQINKTLKTTATKKGTSLWERTGMDTLRIYYSTY